MISTEFRRTMKPLIMANSILATGLLEYYDDHTSNAIGLIYACFSVFVYFCVSYILIFVLNAYMNKGAFMLRATYTLHTCSHSFFLVYTITAGIIRKKKIKYVLRQMESCIQSMHELGIPKNYPKVFKHLCYILLGAFLVLLCMCIIDILWGISTKPNWSMYILIFIMEHFPFFVLTTSEVSFLFWTMFIKTKFGELNAVLQGMLTTTIDSPQHKRVLQMKDNRKNDSPSHDIYRTYKTDADTKKIKKIKQIHLEWIKCARLVNASYGWFVLMSMTSSFILLTTLFYNVYDLTFEKFMDKKIDFVGFVYWIGYFALKIVVASHVCSITVAEFWHNYYFFLHAAYTGDIICELYEPSTSKEFRAEIRDFTQQIIQNPLIFSICGFFNLDHTFIRSVIGSVTTYLVILIQVGNAPLKFFAGNGTKSTISYADM